MTTQTIDAGSLVAAVADRAVEREETVAVSARDGALTYRELDERSTALARALVSSGIAPEDVVVLFTGRTTSLVVGILAVLKAGAAFLPVDPAHPGERLRRLVALAGATHVVTTAELREAVDTRSDLQGLTPVRCDDPAVDGPGTPLPARSGDSLAYVLPTSGSTGEPKGVLVEDRNVRALVAALHEAVLADLGPDLRVALVAPYVFDASIQQIFGALLLGHTLHVVPEDDRGDGAALRRFWHDHAIDVSDGTPAHLHLLAQARDAAPVGVRQLLIGGDTLSYEDVREFYDRCAAFDTAIANVYGVAECCVDSTIERVGPQEDAPDADPVPIGRELPGTVITLLDTTGDPVGAGETGEVHIAGPGIGRGYLGRPDLTTERFRESSDGARSYRTGDLARRLPDGRLVFLGRADRELKLHGHRISPREVEEVLCGWSGTAPADDGTAVACRRCLLTSAYPGVEVVDDVCSVCRRFDGYRDEVAAYFTGPDELVRRLREHSTVRRSGYDVLLLFSGGKDSSYALYRLLDLGFRVLAYTFDNGYISSRAFENIHRITSNAGVDLEIGATPAMDQVFAESLQQDSTVCSGCFRGLTALSTRLAVERGIGAVATGLSRGQIYDTKLQRLVEAGIRDPEEIDRRLLGHRKIYHARQDRTSELLDVGLRDGMLDDIAFVDYFRHDPVSSAEVRRYLAERDPLWSEPTDTGMCSTNCLMNNVGIHVHSAERGFHNYASPLSWDCRLGVLDREQGLRELSEDVPEQQVTAILDKLGYQPSPRHAPIRQAAVVARRPRGRGPLQLHAYYAAAEPVDDRALREHMAARLPAFMVPHRFVHLTRLPVTDSGKVDHDALPDAPDPGELDPTSMRARPGTERRLADIWVEVLDVENIPRTVDFFTLGGDSLTATIVTSIAQSEFRISLTPTEFFARPTLEWCAELVDSLVSETSAGRSAVTARALDTAASPRGGYLVLPDVSGSVDMYRPLAARTDRRMTGLAGPSMLAATGDPRIEDFCEPFVDRITAEQPDGPYRLAGWSFGAIVALQVARRLAERGETVEHLLVLDIVPPDPDYWTEQLRLWRDFADGGGPIPPSLRQVLRPHSVHGQGAVDAYARAAFPVLSALSEFEPEGTFVQHMTCVRAAESPEEHLGEGWQRYSHTPARSAVVDGDHFSLLEARSAGRVAALLGVPA